MPTSKSPYPPGHSARLLASALLRLGWVKERKYKKKGWDSYAENLQFKLFKLRHIFSSRRTLDCARQKMDKLRICRLTQLPFQFKHSGNSGDVIYALPAMRALSNGARAGLFLNLDVPINNWSKQEHPLGKSGLTDGMVDFLRPLLEHQSWLTFVNIYKNEPVNYDLDAFRIMPGIPLGRGHIAHYYSWIYPLTVDLTQPWLELPPVTPRHKIVLARSARYRNVCLNYAFLRDCGDIDFVGTVSEFEEMRQVIPQLNYVACPDALQLASAIKSARFFIGNQSFPYSIAEALKVPRILEICPPIPDIVPAGGKIGEAFFQSNFEALVKAFLAETQ